MAEHEKGFEIAFDAETSMLRLRLWGLWDTEVGQNLVWEFKKHVQNVSTMNTTWYVLADLTEFPPQFGEVQQYLSEAMLLAKQHGMKKGARIVANTITKMQIARLSRETGVPESFFFQSEEAAIHWLLSE